MKQHFLQLAHSYNPNKHSINGWFMSEKLDGVRAFWDGGVSRGKIAATIPWANVEKDKKETIATGLWSRYGKVIYAPDWWLNKLPNIMLDGELYMGPQKFQYTVSCVKQHTPNGEWDNVRFMVLDAPRVETFLRNRHIREVNFKKVIDNTGYGCGGIVFHDCIDFMSTYSYLKESLPISEHLRLLKQIQLPMKTDEIDPLISEAMDDVLANGGEGLIFRRGITSWIPERTHDCLKHKPANDAEGTVTGYIWGRRTDKGSKLLGKMGALILDYNGKRLELSGFTDDERKLDCNNQDSINEGEEQPGEEVSSAWSSRPFPIGSKVSFKYRELSNDGVPKEARFFRRYQTV